MKKSIKAAIIGCGDIAGAYDERKRVNGVFSHAGAYRSLRDVEIIAAFDVNAKRMDGFCHYWNIDRRCKTLEELLNEPYDIVSICTPDDTHQTILEKTLAANCAKCIWIEKPLTLTASGAEKVIQIAKEKKVGLWLSNQRRWEPEHLAIKNRIRKGELGELVHATGYYVKGLTHVGCTLIDTLRFLCGEVIWALALPSIDAGGYNGDLSVSGIMGFHNGMAASIIACDKRGYAYSLFEIDIICTNGRIKIEENGDIILVYRIKAHDKYSGFKELRLAEKIATQMKWAMKYGMGLLLKNISENKQPFSSAIEGLKDLRVIEALKHSSKNGGKRISIKNE